MSRRDTFWMMCTAVACLLALTAAQTVRADAALTIGSKAPAIDIEHWVRDRGGAFKPIKEFAPGKVYVIEFWATWCGPCVASMPHLAQLQDEYADKGVTVISISDEDLDTIEKFLDEKVDEDGEKTYRDLTQAYCLTADPDGSVSKDYMEAAEEDGIPTAFIVGKTGEIEWIGHPMEMDEPLEKIVGGKWDRAEFAREKKAMDAFEERLSHLEELVQEGKGAQAVEFYDILMAEAPNEEAKAWLQGLRFRVLLGGGPAALEALGALVKAADGSVDKLNEVAWAVLMIVQHGTKADADMVAAAVAAAKKATELDGTRADILDTLAHLYEIQGDLAKAIETQREAVKNAGPAKDEFEGYLKELEESAATK